MKSTLKEKINEVQKCLLIEKIETYSSEIDDTLVYSTSSLERNYKLKGILEAILSRELVSETLRKRINDLIKEIENSIA